MNVAGRLLKLLGVALHVLGHLGDGGEQLVQRAGLLGSARGQSLGAGGQLPGAGGHLPGHRVQLPEHPAQGGDDLLQRGAYGAEVPHIVPLGLHGQVALGNLIQQAGYFSDVSLQGAGRPVHGLGQPPQLVAGFHLDVGGQPSLLHVLSQPEHLSHRPDGTGDHQSRSQRQHHRSRQGGPRQHQHQPVAVLKGLLPAYHKGAGPDLVNPFHRDGQMNLVCLASKNLILILKNLPLAVFRQLQHLLGLALLGIAGAQLGRFGGVGDVIAVVGKNIAVGRLIAARIQGCGAQGGHIDVAAGNAVKLSVAVQQGHGKGHQPYLLPVGENPGVRLGDMGNAGLPWEGVGLDVLIIVVAVPLVDHALAGIIRVERIAVGRALKIGIRLKGQVNTEYPFVFQGVVEVLPYEVLRFGPIQLGIGTDDARKRRGLLLDRGKILRCDGYIVLRKRLQLAFGHLSHHLVKKNSHYRCHSDHNHQNQQRKSQRNAKSQSMPFHIRSPPFLTK
ncbi:hypothetical protein SDC9_105980 [bioreactor metagenome]|uniref:Uncharacterized protein n=1 Tax=bioreactor metagenome TaxID=1076179 RepID=A0A645B123_9ZZZZ